MWIYGLGALTLLILLEFLRSGRVLSVTRKEIFLPRLGKAWEGVKICHLSDLHLSGLLRNGRLEAILATERPDLIVISGDLLDCHHPERQEEVFHFLRRIGGKFPVYCSLGNHEMRIFPGAKGDALEEKFTDAGAILLRNRGIALEKEGENLYLYGYLQPLLPARNPNHARLRQDIRRENLIEALGKCPADGTVLFLAHDPALFPVYAEWGADLILSGHIHGGAVRLPWLGGVLSPARRFFPKYDAGIFSMGRSQMAVSRGLARTEIPRFLNPREVAFFTLRREDRAEQEDQSNLRLEKNNEK